VQIVYSPTGNPDADGVVIKDNVVTHESSTTITAPSALCFQDGVIRVRDKDTGFPTLLYGDSTESFSVLGRVVYGASPDLDDDWYIGETIRLLRGPHTVPK